MELTEGKEGVVEQKDALKIYLDSLLKGEPALPESSASVEVEAVDHDSTATNIKIPADTLDLSDEVADEQGSKPPTWAEEYFSCLPIMVSGITVFVPLRLVRTVKPLPQELEPLEDMPNWIKGNMINLRKSIKVIDMQRIVFQGTNIPKQSDRESQIVIIGNGNWGIACDAVGKVQQLNRDEVKWRSKNAKRRWISGTSMKHMSAILDTKWIEFALALERPLV